MLTSRTIGFFIAITVRYVDLVDARPTYIKSKTGWNASEGSNITLDCKIVRHDQPWNDDYCDRIHFTQNGSIVVEDLTHKMSGPFENWQSSSVNCSMTIVGLQLEDSGEYGCCWHGGLAQCGNHPTKTLAVLPKSITAQTTTEITTMMTTSLKTTATDRVRRKTTHMAYNSIAPESLSSLSSLSSLLSAATNENLTNLAQKQKSTSSLHKTLWPLLLVITLGVIFVVFGVRYVRKGTRDAAGVRRVPIADSEHGEQHVNRNLVCCTSNGVIVTNVDTRIRQETYDECSDR